MKQGHFKAETKPRQDALLRVVSIRGCLFDAEMAQPRPMIDHERVCTSLHSIGVRRSTKGLQAVP